MKRRSFDVVTSAVGLGLAALLLVAGGLLTWAHTFVGNEVHSQLAAQQIYFPPKGSPATAGAEYKGNAPVRRPAARRYRMPSLRGFGWVRRNVLMTSLVSP